MDHYDRDWTDILWSFKPRPVSGSQRHRNMKVCSYSQTECSDMEKDGKYFQFLHCFCCFQLVICIENDVDNL